MEDKNKKFFSGRNIYLIISAVVFISLMAVGTLVFGQKIVDLAKNPDEFRLMIGSSGIKSCLIFLGVQFIQVLFAFIPGEFVEVAAGYAYGGFLGTALCLLGSAAATFVIFGLTRLLGRKFTSIMIDSKNLKRLKFLKNEKKLTWMFAILYFTPGTPKDLITYFAGVTKIKFSTFMLVSTFCRIPSVVTSTFAGSAIGDEKYMKSFIIFAITGAIGFAGYFLYNFISKKHSEHKIKSSEHDN